MQVREKNDRKRSGEGTHWKHQKVNGIEGREFCAVGGPGREGRCREILRRKGRRIGSCVKTGLVAEHV